MIRLLSGDCRDVLATLPAESVQCVVTSPPYYGLRDYGTALWDGGDAGCDHKQQRSVGASTLMNDGRAQIGLLPDHKYAAVGDPFRNTCGKCGAVRVDRQIGLEATPDEYLATMVAVFREVRRVLRRDGTCWVNMGDSYAGSPTSGAARPAAFTANGTAVRGADRNGMGAIAGAKPKDLLLMPARLALALQADGWFIRSAITWCKANPMPESARDRCTSATEMIYMLTKAPKYYFDQDAIRTDSGANARNWWLFSTEAFPSAHFATYPTELAERCIKAGTSERGCCAACGKPWVRVTQGSFVPRPGMPTLKGGDKSLALGGWEVPRGTNDVTTTGWSPGCQCKVLAGDDNASRGEVGTVPCTVLDPFAGAGTSLLVADRLQRDAIGIELNVAYTEMAMERCRADAPLLADLGSAPEPPEDERMADLFDMAAD